MRSRTCCSSRRSHPWRRPALAAPWHEAALATMKRRCLHIAALQAAPTGSRGIAPLHEGPCVRAASSPNHRARSLVRVAGSQAFDITCCIVAAGRQSSESAEELQSISAKANAGREGFFSSHASAT
jgi:hypothetical protein